MSGNKICLKCGSSSLVSDRSLGGKIVCSRCGSSLFKNTLRNKPLIFIIKNKLIFLVICVAILIIIF